MDQSTFDRLARLLGGATTRREGLKSTVGTALGLGLGLRLGIAGASAKETSAGTQRGKKGKGKDRKPRIEGPCGDGSRKDNRCTKDSQCCTNSCRKGLKNKDGEGRCRCIRRGKACKPNQTCCGPLTCTEGFCQRVEPTIPTGQACVSGVDTCAAAAAACIAYDSDDPAGTFCLLPTGGVCASDAECFSQACRDGRCAAVACDVCLTGCPFTDIASAVASPPADGRIRVAPGTWSGVANIASTVRIEACGGAPGVVIKVADGDPACIEVDGGGSVRLKNLSFRFGPSAGSAYTMLAANGSSASSMAVVDAVGCAFTSQNGELAAYLYGFFTATMTDCVMQGAPVYAGTDRGAAPGDPSTLAITRSRIDAQGLGIPVYTEDLDLAITDSAITGGSGFTGGFFFGSGQSGVTRSFTLRGATTVSGNTGTDEGGGGLLSAISGGIVAFTMEDASAISGNTAPNGSGVAAILENGSGIVVNGAASRVTGNTGAPSQCAVAPDFASSWTPVPDCTAF